jgi:hypothetical protein
MAVPPRVLHQLWIGPHPRPQACLDSWAARLPAGFRHMIWDEAALEREGMVEAARRRGVLRAIDAIGAWNGKADVWRWVILAERGGVFSDADAECVESIEGLLRAGAYENASFLAAFENESARGPGSMPGLPDVPQDVPLVATGFMACGPGHPVVLNALDEIAAQSEEQCRVRAPWRSVGPALLTRALRRLCGPALSAPWLRLLPSYAFYPEHATGLVYRGHGKVYARQLWGSTPGKVPAGARKADERSEGVRSAAPSLSVGAVSLLVCSRDAKAHHLRACLDSVLHQQGDFELEVVWVDDRSAPLSAAVLRRMLDGLEARGRRLVVRRARIEGDGGGGPGVAAALNKGLGLCSHDLVARMDADDIMALDRLERQLAYMAARPDLVCLGAQAALFNDGEERPHGQTHHAARFGAEELAAYGASRMPRWLANHPTLMFRRAAVVAAGGYRAECEGAEDYDLLLRLLVAHGEIRNMPDVLLYYRRSAGQVTARNAEARAALQDSLAAAFVGAVSLRSVGAPG